jgi:RHS repeat-associated protein
VRPSSATIPTPAGWTLVRRVDSTVGQTNALAVFQKVAGGSEPAAYSWDMAGAAYAAGGIQAFANVDTANPIDVEAGQATPSSLSHATPSVTTTVANAMLVTAHGFATSTTWTPPAGMTEAFEAQYQPVPSGQGHSIEGNYGLQPTAGATGAKTATALSGADEGATHILALRPSPQASVQLYFIHVDHLNTPRLIADENQTTVWTWEQQEPFGDNPANEDPDGNSVAFEFNLRFPGQYFDKETNLAYNVARDYDSAIGSYVQADPIGVLTSLNMYGYGLQNPLTNVDPTGEFVVVLPALPAFGEVAVAVAGLLGGALLASSLERQDPKGATVSDGDPVGSGKYYCQVRANIYPIQDCPNCPQIAYGNGYGRSANEAWNNALASVNGAIPVGCGYRHPHGVGGSCKGWIGGKR